MIDIVALGGGFKYLRKIHLNTQKKIRFAILSSEYCWKISGLFLFKCQVFKSNLKGKAMRKCSNQSITVFGFCSKINYWSITSLINFNLVAKTKAPQNKILQFLVLNKNKVHFYSNALPKNQILNGISYTSIVMLGALCKISYYKA